MLATKPYAPDRSFFAKLERRLTQYRRAAPANIETDRPLLSITFDDCPITAAEAGARILEEFDVRGGYYIATGLMGKNSHMGLVSTPDHICELNQAGHEIGAHSHSHLDCARENADCIFADIDKNIQMLREICDTFQIESFAFPYGETRFGIKKQLSENFLTLRGILPGINRGRVDRAQLRAYEIDHSDWTFQRAFSALDNLAERSGWMLVFSHDVSDRPSEHGMTPDQLRRLIDRSLELGIDICTPSEAAHRAGLSI